MHWAAQAALGDGPRNADQYIYVPAEACVAACQLVRAEGRPSAGAHGGSSVVSCCS